MNLKKVEPTYNDASAVLLKYISLHSPFLAMKVSYSIALKAWFCPDTGAPCLGSGIIHDLPLDYPVAVVFLPGESLAQIKDENDQVSSDLLDSIAQQLREQSQDIEPLSSTAKSFIKDLFTKDSELRKIKQCRFKLSTQHSFQLSVSVY